MALRILTGVIIPKSDSKKSGSATVSFNPHKVTGDAKGVELDNAGSAGDFRNRPGKVISLRQVKIRDKDTFTGGSENDRLKINDDPVTTSSLVVRWKATGGSDIEELSYMIVGDV